MTSHIFKQPQSNNFYFRWTVPIALRSRFGFNTVKKTTGTSDPKKAQRLADKYLAECLALVAEYRGEPAEQFTVRGLIAVERIVNKGITDQEIADMASWVEKPQEVQEALNVELGILTGLAAHIPGWKVWCLASGRKETTVKTWESSLNVFTKHVNTVEELNQPKEILKAASAIGHSASSQKKVVAAVKSLCKYITREITHEPIETEILKLYRTSDLVDNGAQDKTLTTADISKVTGYDLPPETSLTLM